MYDFEVKVKVLFLYEITYEEIVKEFDQRGEAYDRKVMKTERFTEWSKLRSFAYELKNKKILQVTEIKDVTSALRNDMTTQGKD
jgi:hypothetical protein